MSLKRFAAVAAISLATAVAGCQSSDEGTDTGSPDAGTAVMPVAACGMPSYTLLPRNQVGKLVSYEELPLLNLEQSQIAEYIKSAGFEGKVEIPYGCRVFLFRYTTQDRGKSVEATATLGIPANVELPKVDFPLAVFGHGTTGFSDPCAPSREFEGQASSAILASQGFVTVSPDYIGMTGSGAPSTTTHGYLVGEQVAIGMWDALRAGELLLKKIKGAPQTGKATVVWGASQGGHAALFTELYGPYYAPEFDVKAVAAMVPPSVLMPLAQKAMEKFSPPTVSFAAVLTTMREWYGAPADLGGIITDSDPFFFAGTLYSQIFVKEKCNPGEAFEKALKEEPNVRLMYKDEFINAVLAGDLEGIEPWGCYLNENSLATSRAKPRRFVPTMMIYSENDDLVVTEPMRQDFDRLCTLGYRLDYLECKNATHSEGAAWSLPEQVAWVRARLAGEPLPADICQRRAPVCCSGAPAEKCK
jgi:hypothetical protein